MVRGLKKFRKHCTKLMCSSWVIGLESDSFQEKNNCQLYFQQIYLIFLSLPTFIETKNTTFRCVPCSSRPTRGPCRSVSSSCPSFSATNSPGSGNSLLQSCLKQSSRTRIERLYPKKILIRWQNCYIRNLQTFKIKIIWIRPKNQKNCHCQHKNTFK